MSRGVVQCAATLAGFDEKDARLVMLAVDEACTNVIRHSYEGDVTQRIVVTCRWTRGERLEVRLKDFGKKVNPAIIRDFEKEDKTKPGGLGLNIMRQVMDTVEYDPACQDCIELRMVKQIAPSEEE